MNLDAHSCTLLRVLINRYHPNDVARFCRYLPQDSGQAVEELSIDVDDPAFVWQTPGLWLKHIHYSWLAPAIAAFPSLWQEPIVAALEPQQSTHLRLMIGLEKAAAPTPLARQFLQRMLFDKLQLSEVTPLQLVPSSPFYVLATWDKPRLVELIDFLSMYDLKEKIRHIVDRRRLRDLYAILSKGRLEFLRSIMHQREKVTSGSLPLETWQGDRNSLQNLLHQRGLIRLGTALCGQSEALMWHISHRLDTGRGAIIMRYYRAKTPPHIVQILVQQVMALIEYLDNGEKSDKK